MSFSQEVKKELCSIETQNDCCQRAEAYGLLYYGKAFSKDEICIMTDYDYVARKYKNAIELLIQSSPNEVKSKSGKITVSIDNNDDRLDILNELGYTGNERTMRILTTNIENECCFGAFLRGVFLSCGIITDPKKEYHLEFSIPFKTKCKDLTEMFFDFPAIPKQSDRNGMNLIYFKDSEHIENILTVMGANNSVLELIGEKILKDVRNNVNRKVNCDNANIKKTCMAAALQTKAIENLMKNGKFDELSSDMQELARLRISNQEMTLNELGAALSKPISRSGVNHRLKKLIELSNESELN